MIPCVYLDKNSSIIGPKMTSEKLIKGKMRLEALSTNDEKSIAGRVGMLRY
jgi:hypothetical protein